METYGAEYLSHVIVEKTGEPGLFGFALGHETEQHFLTDVLWEGIRML